MKTPKRRFGIPRPSPATNQFGRTVSGTHFLQSVSESNYCGSVCTAGLDAAFEPGSPSWAPAGRYHGGDCRLVGGAVSLPRSSRDSCGPYFGSQIRRSKEHRPAGRKSLLSRDELGVWTSTGAHPCRCAPARWDEPQSRNWSSMASAGGGVHPMRCANFVLKHSRKD